MSCDPQNIAPLPSPAEPDGTRVLLSSLTAGDPSTPDVNRLISVVGTPGAVGDVGTVEITNTRTGVLAVASATPAGTFAGKSYGQPGDTLELVYIDDSGYRSAVTSLDVLAYVLSQPTEPNANTPRETAQPLPPGEDFEVGGGTDSATNCSEEDAPCATEEGNESNKPG